MFNYLKIPIKHFLGYIESLKWHRDSQVVLVGAWFGEKYADNSRYLFQYLSDHKNELGLTHVVWVTRNPSVKKLLDSLGYECYIIGSNESTYYHKVAKYHIICNLHEKVGNLESDIDTRYSYGAVRINLWHGVLTFKGVGRASRESKEKTRKNPTKYLVRAFFEKSRIFRALFGPEGGWRNCYYTTTSRKMSLDLQAMFEIPMNYFIECGSPRVCDVVTLLPEEINLINEFKQYSSVLLYLPTFRYPGSHFNPNQLSTDLSEYLSTENILLVQKAHGAATNKNETGIDSKNIITLPQEFDINTIIPYIDIFITDYSTAVAEAMYFYKKILFYSPDIKEYRDSDRGFIVDLDDVMCGECATNTSDFLNILKECITSNFSPDEHYMEIRNKYWNAQKDISYIWNSIKKLDARDKN